MMSFGNFDNITLLDEVFGQLVVHGGVKGGRRRCPCRGSRGGTRSRSAARKPRRRRLRSWVVAVAVGVPRARAGASC